MITPGNRLRRTAVSDANLQTGRYARLGTGKAADVLVQVSTDSGLVGGAGVLRGGCFARYVDVNNWLMLVRNGWGGAVGSKPSWSLLKRVAGAEPTLLTSGSYGSSGGGMFLPLTLAAFSSGACQVKIAGAEYNTPPDKDLVSGGVLETGGFGVYDAYTGASALTREYDDFAVVSGSFDAVLYASRSARLTSKGFYRLGPDGAAYGSVAFPVGDLPRVPVSGPENRPVQVCLKPSRGDFGAVSDSGIDKVAAELAYRPCWSYVPD